MLMTMMTAAPLSKIIISAFLSGSGFLLVSFFYSDFSFAQNTPLYQQTKHFSTDASETTDLHHQRFNRKQLIAINICLDLIKRCQRLVTTGEKNQR